MKTIILKITCMMLVVTFSLSCGGGGVEGPESISALNVTLTGTADVSGLSKPRQAADSPYTFELVSLGGDVLKTFVSNSLNYSFENVTKGQHYIVRLTTSDGFVIEALTGKITDNEEQDIDLNTSVSLALLEELYGDLKSRNDLNSLRTATFALVEGSQLIQGVDWVTSIKNHIKGKRVNDTDFWNTFPVDFDDLKNAIADQVILENEELNKAFSINGVVKTTEGNPIVGVEIQDQESGELLATSDGDGAFLTKSLEKGLHKLSFIKNGYSEGFLQIWLGDDGVEDGITTILVGSGQYDDSGVELAKGLVNISLKASTSVSLNSSTPISLGKASPTLTQRFTAKGGQAYAVIKNKKGKAVWRKKYAGASLDFSMVDPSSEINAMPGSLVTSGTDELGKPRKPRYEGDASADDALESVSMLDISLRDENNQKIDLEEGDHLETYIKIPESQQEKYRDQYDKGDRVIPFYSYSQEEGKWVLENEAELVLIGGTMYGRSKILHFSWWNMDYPEKRTILKGKVYGDLAKTKVLSGVRIDVDAVGTNYGTKVYTNDNGDFSLYVKRNEQYRLIGNYNGLVSDEVFVEVGNNSESDPYVAEDMFIVSQQLSGKVISAEGEELPRALIKLPDGSGIYSDINGNYSVDVSNSSSFDLLAQYYNQSIDTSFVQSYSFTPSDFSETVLTKNLEIDINDILYIQGTIKRDTSSGLVNVEGATVYTTAGGTKVLSDENGQYRIPISKSVSKLARTEDTLIVPLRVFYYNTDDRSYPSKNLDLSINLDADSFIQNIIFQEGEKISLKGSVEFDGEPVVGTEVISDAGSVTYTNDRGEFEFFGYPGQVLEITAKIVDDTGETRRKSQKIELFAFEDGNGGFAPNRMEKFSFTTTASTLYGIVTTVLSDGTEVPVPGVVVISPNTKKTATTGSDGRYSIKLSALKKTKNVIVQFRYKKKNLLSPPAKFTFEAGVQYEYNLQLDSSVLSNPAPVFDSVELSSYRVAAGDNIEMTFTVSDPDKTLKKSGSTAILENIDFQLTNITDGFGGSIEQMTAPVQEKNNVVYKYLYTPPSDQLGWVTLKADATDIGNATTSQTIGIEVVSEIQNNEPTLLGLEAPSETSKNSEVRVKLAAWDVDGDDLTYQFSISPENNGASFSNEVIRSNLRGGKSEILDNVKKLIFDDANGTYVLTVSCSDGTETVSESKSITIVNEPPQILNFEPSVEVLTYGTKPQNFSIRAEDVEGDDLTYTWEYAVTESVDDEASDLQFSAMPSGLLKLNNTRLQLNTRSLVDSSKNNQFLFLKVSVSDGENTVYKQIRLSILPAGLIAEKTPSRIRVEATIGEETANSVFLSHLSGVGYDDTATFRVYLVYNTGDEDLVTQNVTVSGNGQSTAIVNRDTGKITFKGEGDIELDFFYTSNGATYETQLTVEMEPLGLSGLLVTATNWFVTVGSSFQTYVEAIFENDAREDVTFSSNTNFISEQPDVATIDESGLVTGRNPGVATLGFSHFDSESSTTSSATKEVQVLPIEIVSIAGYPTPIQMEVGERPNEFQLEIIYNNETSVELQRKNALLWFDGSEIAILNDNYDIVPVSAGNTLLNFSYTENDITVSSNMEIMVSEPSPEIVRMEVFPENLELQPGDMQLFQIFAVFNNGEREQLATPTIRLNEFEIENDISNTTSTSISDILISGNFISFSDNLTLEALAVGQTNIQFGYQNFEVSSVVKVVPEPNEAIIEEIASLGGAVYSSKIVTKKIGLEETDILVYNKGRKLATVDIGDPANRNDLTEITLNEWISDFDISDRFIHVTNWYGEYSMVTFDNPALLEQPAGYGASIEGYAYGVKSFFWQGDGFSSRYAVILSNKRWARQGRYGVSGLVILDITNPLNVVKVGKIQLNGWMSEFTIKDDIVYVTSREGWDYNSSTRRWERSGYTGVQAVDISDPTAPRVVEKLNLGSYTYGIEASGNTLVVSSRGSSYQQSNLTFYDISSPSSPSQSEVLSLPFYWARGISFSDNGLYLSLGSQGVGFVQGNIDTGHSYQNSWQPAPASWVTADGEGENDMSGGYWTYAYDVQVKNGYVYISNGHNGMSIYKLNGDDLGDEVTGYPNISYVTDTIRAGKFSVVSSGYGGILSFDNSDAAKPVLVDVVTDSDYSFYRMEYDETTETIFISAYARSYYWWWGYFGVDGGNSPYVVMAFRLEDNGHLTELSRQSLPGSAQDMIFENGRLYLTTNNYSYSSSTVRSRGYVSVFEWDSSTLSPSVEFVMPSGRMPPGYNYTYDYSSRAYGLTVANDKVYVATPGGLSILQEQNSDLTEIKLVPASDLTDSTWRYWFYASRIHVFGDDRFLALPTWSGVHVLGLIGDSNVQWLSRYDSNWYSDIAFSGNIALLAGYEELEMVDYRDPVNPELVLSKDIGGWKQSISWQDELALFASGWEGISFYKVVAATSGNNALPVILDEYLGEVYSGNSISKTLDIFEGDGDTVSLSGNSLSDLGGSLSINDLDLFYTSPANTSGTDYFYISASDGIGERTATFSVNILAVNTPPSISLSVSSPLNVNVGQPYVITATGSDDDNDSLNYSWEVISGANIDFSQDLNQPNQITLTVSGPSSSTPIVRASVNDGTVTVYSDITLNVNNSPEITLSGNYLFQILEQFSITPNVTDSDGTVIEYQWTQTPEFFNLGSNNMLTISGNASGSGNAVLTLSVTDDGGAISNSDTLVEIAPEPTIVFSDNTIVGANQIINHNAFIDYLFSDYTSSWNHLSGLSVSNLSSSLSDNIASVSFVAPGQIGTFTLSLNVMTSTNYLVSENLMFTVNATPHAFLDDDFFVVNVGETATLQGNVNDNDTISSNLLYSWSQISGVDLGLNSANLNLLRPEFIVPANGSQVEMLLTVSDGYSSSNVLQTFWINTAPTADAGSDQTVSVNALVQLDATSTNDVDGDTLSYTWLQLSGNNVVLGGSTTMPTFTAPSFENTLTFQLTVDDGYSSSTDNVTIYVEQPSTALEQALSQKISAGYGTTLIIDNSYALSTGRNNWGQLGLGDTTNRTSLNTIFSSEAIGISSGNNTGAVLKEDGSLWAFGQLGTSANTMPTQLISSNVSFMSVGNSHILALKDDGALVGFGNNKYGQLGLSDFTTRTNFEVISSNVQFLSAGLFHSAFVKNDGSLWMMGLINGGPQESPIEIMSSNVSVVSAGAGFTLILNEDGALFAVGENQYGQLGDGTTTDKSSAIEIVSGNVSAIASGYFHSLYLLENGDLYAMGLNSFGQLGDGTTINKTSPVFIDSNVSAISAGAYHSIIQKNDGGIYMVGENQYGQFGDGTTQNSLSFTKIDPKGLPVSLNGSSSHSLLLTSIGDVWATGKNDYGNLGTGNYISSNVFIKTISSNVVSIATGELYSFAVMKDGSLWSTGFDNYGSLGLNGGNSISWEMNISSNISKVDAGQYHSMVLKEDGSLWATGYNGFGQLGTGSTNNIDSWIEVISDNVVDFAAGKNHTLVLMGNGSVLGAGYNAHGQLGDGTTSSNSNFINIVSDNVSSIAAGDTFSLMLKEDGSLWATGIYQGGDPAYGASSNSQFTMIESANVMSISAGDAHALYVMSDNSIWSIGYNASGQLGDGTTVDKSMPIEILQNGEAVYAGKSHSFITSSSNIYGFGSNFDGQLGDQTNVDKVIPTDINWLNHE